MAEGDTPLLRAKEHQYSRQGVFAAWLLLGFPLPFVKQRWECEACGHQWKENA